MKKSLILKVVFFLLVIAAILAVGVTVLEKGNDKPVDAQVIEDSVQRSPGDKEEAKAVNVVTSRLVQETVEETFTLPGTLEAWENLTLSLEQSGPITWVGPREGDDHDDRYQDARNTA